MTVPDGLGGKNRRRLYQDGIGLQARKYNPDTRSLEAVLLTKDLMKNAESMLNITIIELADVAGKPRIKMGLSSLFRIGDPLTLHFRLQRQNGTRTEALEVSGVFRVTAVSFDATSGTERQHLSVTSMGVVPVWKAIKKVAPMVRQLPPTHFPRTVVA